jgi:hypothetical protein
MSKSHSHPEKDDQVTKISASMFGIIPDKFRSYGKPLDRLAEIPEDKVARMPAMLSFKNKPEFWTDASWRLEPDQDYVPISMYIRDANIDSPGNGPWRLDILTVEQSLTDQSWYQLATLTPQGLPNISSHGEINQGYWSHSIKIPISDIQIWLPGSYVHLRVKFTGSAHPYKKTSTIEKHIEVFRAEFSLPLARASTSYGPRKWFYGDTHYHSAYTNDIKEFGSPIPETRAAGKAIGLDWIVITDHSTNLDEIDPGYGGKTRWERLKTELSSTEISDDQFRFILGEEITLIGKDYRLVHMLAMEALDQMIEGAFLPEESNRIDINFYRTVIESIIKLGRRNNPVIRAA